MAKVKCLSQAKPVMSRNVFPRDIKAWSVSRELLWGIIHLVGSLSD